MRKFLLTFIVLLSACSNITVSPTSIAVPTSTTIPATVETHATLPPPLIPPPQPFPTATPYLHPMAIDTLRQGLYPGSDIIIEGELDPGPNYRRYYASYISEGLTIYGLLTVPNGDMPVGGWPAIVFNHGYIPPDVYRTTERYIAYVDRLASSGYVVFRIDYRGHDRSEGEASGAYGNPGYLVDVLNAVASVKRFPSVNPAQIGMWGHSLGGYLTLRAMVISPDIKAGVIWAGVVGSYPDLLYNWRRSGAAVTPSPSSQGRRWRAQWLEDYGTPDENPAFWNSISANSYLTGLSGPIQLHHGTEDQDVPLVFSQTLYDQIRQAGEYAELYTYPGDNHNISNYFSQAMDRTIEFFDQYLR